MQFGKSGTMYALSSIIFIEKKKKRKKKEESFL